MSVAIPISEAQSMALYGDRPASLAMYRDLREALAWFRAEWQATIMARLHEHGTGTDDALGGPAWTHRFEAFITDPPRDPVRIALAKMAHGSLFERAGARFLFALACRDFEPRAAGLSLPMPIPPEYVGWYTEKAIDRLREVMDRLPERERPSGARIVDRPAWMGSP